MNKREAGQKFVRKGMDGGTQDMAAINGLTAVWTPSRETNGEPK